MVQMPTLGSMEPGPIDPGSLPTLVHDSLGAYLISLLATFTTSPNQVFEAR